MVLNVLAAIPVSLPSYDKELKLREAESLMGR